MPEQDANLPSLTFLFWNVRKESGQSRTTPQKQSGSVAKRRKTILDAIAQLALAHSVDILIFAELELASADVSQALKDATTRDYSEPEPDQCTKIRIFTPYADSCLPVPQAGNPRYTVRQVEIPDRTSFLLVATHLPDKSSSRTTISRYTNCQEVTKNVSTAEKQYSHQRTVIVGDCNVNPYEPEITGAMQGMMTRLLAKKGYNTETGLHTRFYNPMWQHFGETAGTPPGTFYWPGESDEHQWNIYDQVLLRPPLLDSFNDKDLSILNIAGNVPLVTKEGRPRRQAVSDHLPILFRLKL